MLFADTCSSSKLNGSRNTVNTSKLSVAEASSANAAQPRQKVTQGEIIRMKDTGVPTEQLVMLVHCWILIRNRSLDTGWHV